MLPGGTTEEEHLRPPTPLRREGAGEPVVLLHPFSLSHHVWGRVIDDLAADFDVLAPTLLGHWGAERVRPWQFSVGACADHIERVLDEAGLEAAHLVGNSLGGWVAFELERRGRARSVVALAPAGGWNRWTWGEIGLGLWFLSLYPALLVGRLLGDPVFRHERLQLQFLASAVRRPQLVPEEQRLEALRAAAHCPAYLSMILAGVRDGPATGLEAVHAPTMLAWCECDRVVKRASQRRRYDEGLPAHTERVVLPGVGHVPQLEQPAMIATLVREFIAKQRPADRETA